MKNKLTFPFIMLCIAAIMYFIAFHEMRAERNQLKTELETIKKVYGIKDK